MTGFEAPEDEPALAGGSAHGAAADDDEALISVEIALGGRVLLSVEVG